MRSPLLFLSVLVACLVSAKAASGTEDLARVWDDMRLGRWADAEAALRQRGGGRDAQGRFAEAALWQNRRPGARPEKARELYRDVIREFPESPWAAWALLAEARMSDLDVLKPNPEAAIPLYRKVMADYPESNASQEAVLHLAEALWEAHGTDGAREGVAELMTWKSAHPSAAYAPSNDLLTGLLFRYPLEDHPAAVAHLRAALDGGLRALSQRVLTCWSIASLAEHKLGDRELAVEYYTRFLRDFPNHRLGFRARQALARLGAPVPPDETPTLQESPQK